VNNCLVKLTLIAGGAMLASHAYAQPAAQPADAPATTTLKASPSAPSSSTVTTNVAANLAANARTVNAAGSILILADGIVAGASMAQIHPPAPGFVYER
jgi:hypothetical protein